MTSFLDNLGTRIEQTTEETSDNNHLQFAREDKHELLQTKGLPQTQLTYIREDEKVNVHLQTSLISQFGNAFLMHLKICNADNSKDTSFLPDMSNFKELRDLCGKTLYLVAVVCHKGEKITQGHYVTQLFFEDQEIVVNDENEETIDHHRDANPYLLFYAPKRINRTSTEYTVEGEQNYGNVCFMNATIQALRMVQACCR